MVPQTNLYEQYLELKKTQFPTLPQQEKGLYQEYLESKVKRKPTLVREEPRLADWKKEFLPALGETFAGHIKREKFPEMVTPEYWKKTYGNVKRSIQDIADLTGFTMTPETREKIQQKIAGLPAKSVMTPTGKGFSPEAVEEIVLTYLGKPPEVVKKAMGLIAWLPEMGTKLLGRPVETIRDDPVGTILLLMATSPKVRSLVKKKARAGKPINMHEATDSIPEKILTEQQKAKIKSALPEQLELPLTRLEPVTPVQKVINALKEAKPLRKKQEALYTAERGKRFAEAKKVGKRVKGEKGFYAEKARLKGELPKVKFEPIRDKLTQPDVDAMFKQIADSPALHYLETLPAREGLAKLFGKYGGRVPTGNELMLLDRVFGREFVQTVLSKRARWDKIKSGILEAANVPRALMASYDLSFGLRQGIFLATRYPKQFASAFAKQFKLFGSEKAFKLLKEEIASRPTYELMTRGKRKLALTEMDATLSLREEAFMGAAWAEKIPLVGRGVRASARAYTGFANKLRADVFDHLIKSVEKTGRNPWKEPALVDSIIDFVNAGSGRGSLKMLEKAAVNLNTVLFSPRLMSSRLNLLNPRFYYKLDPFVRKQALQSLFAFAGMTTTVLGLAKLGGLEVNLDPRSADFAKIKIGNTRLDIMGGFQQYIRTATQFITGTTVSTTTGRVAKVSEGYKPQTRLGVLTRGLEYKLAPVASFSVNLLRGRTTFGEPIDVPEEVGRRFVPMVMQDVIDLARDDPDLLPVSIIGFFGTGIQTYGPRKKKGVVY